MHFLYKKKDNSRLLLYKVLETSIHYMLCWAMISLSHVTVKTCYAVILKYSNFFNILFCLVVSRLFSPVCSGNCVLLNQCFIYPNSTSHYRVEI